MNGVQTQVYTCYRLLEPTSNSPTVNPGTSAISLAVAVKGAPHGYKFHPTVKAWTAWDASNPTNTGTHKQAENTPQDVTVSAKLNLNVRMTQGQPQYSSNGVWNFSKATGYINSELGKQKGVLGLYNFAIETRWKDRTKGLKGIELPKGDISFDFRISNAYRNDGSTTAHDKEAAFQPYFWDFANTKDPAYNTNNQNRSTAGIWRPRDDNYQYPVSTGDNDHSTYGNGSYSVTQKRDNDGTTFHVTLKDLKIDYDKFPTKAFINSDSIRFLNCTPGLFMNNSCSQMEVGEISVGSFIYFNPTTIGGKNVTEHYNHDVTLLSNATDVNLSATSQTGDRLQSSKTNDNQAVTEDDRMDMSDIFRLPGQFIQRILYDCNTNPNLWETSCGWWGSQDVSSGTDSLLQGATASISSGFNYQTSVEDLPVMALNLVKWDTTVFDPSTAHIQDNLVTARFGYQMGSVKSETPSLIWYAVKKDGKAWSSDDEQRKAGYDDLNYYSSYKEASEHGVVVGMLLGGRDAAYTETAGRSTNASYFGSSIGIKIRDNAKVGAVAQLTGVAATWTRSQLKKAGLTSLDPTESSDDEWREWASQQNPWQMYQTTKPRFQYGSKTYIKATYDKNGNYQGGDTSGVNRGDSMLVVGEQPKIGKTIAQKDSKGQIKTIYDLDKEQRYADWDVTVKADTNNNSAGTSYTSTDLYVTDTLPKGLTYVDGSAYLDGTYKESNGGQEKGTVSGGTPITPTIKKNDDGTTTLKMTVVGVPSEGSTHHVHLTTSIGDASNPDSDSKNGQQYTNHVEIQSKRNGAKPDKGKGTIAEATIRVSRTHSSALATRAQPLLNDVEKPLGFTNMLGNFSKDEKKNPYAVDIMPYSGAGSLSKYSGGYVMTGLNMGVKNGASLDNVRVYFTTDPKWRTVDATKITREQVEQWTEAKVDRNTGTVTIPDGCDKPVAWAFTSDKLPANARYDFSFAFKPSGNKAADAYVNRWTDGDNKVDAVTQVVERRVNGVAWFDNNHNGVRESIDRLLAGVNVTLLNKNGKTVTSVNGKPCTTVTDQNGHYELSAIPGGSGFKLRFTPKTGTTWRGQHVTVKNAKEASEATDSDSDEEDDSNGNMVAGVIRLKDFPALDKMTTAVYEDPNEDHGIYGMVMPTVPATFKAVKVLNGRPNGAWTDKDKYVADITPLDNAPKSAMPASITFTDNRTKTVKINSGAFPHGWRLPVSGQGTQGRQCGSRLRQPHLDSDRHRHR